MVTGDELAVSASWEATLVTEPPEPQAEAMSERAAMLAAADCMEYLVRNVMTFSFVLSS
jgi:hypothetical protein